MADTVVVKKLFESQRRVVYQFSNKSDGTGESAVQKIDISTLTADGITPTRLDLVDIAWSVVGFDYVELLWDHTSDVSQGVFSGQGGINYKDTVGVNKDTGSGGTGDVLLTTSGGYSGASYLIVAEYIKKV